MLYKLLSLSEELKSGLSCLTKFNFFCLASP